MIGPRCQTGFGQLLTDNLGTVSLKEKGKDEGDESEIRAIPLVRIPAFFFQVSHRGKALQKDKSLIKVRSQG